MSAHSAIAKAVGARLRELRLDAEMSQAVVAKLVGSHRPIISRIERGVGEVSLYTLFCYAAALDLDVATVLEPIRIESLLEVA